MKRKYRQKGQALIEFMIFLPLTIIFALSLIEVGMIFNTSQRVTNLSREAANTALQLCWEDEPTQDGLRDCLTNTALPALVDSAAPNTLKDFLVRGQIMISAYYRDQDTGAVVGPICVSGGKSSSCRSRFDDSGSFETLVQDLGLVFVGECFYEYKTLMNLSFFTVPWELYDHTVF